MRLVGGDQTLEVEGLGHRVLVGRHGRPEGKVAEGLKGVVELIKPRVARGPPLVTLREGGRRGRRQAQQPVAAVANHVDREVVAGEHVEVGPHAVAEREPLPLEPPRKRRMLGAHAVWDREELGVALERQHSTAGYEGGGEFEADERRRPPGEGPVAGEHRRVSTGGEAIRRKDHGRGVRRENHLDLPAVGGLVEGRSGRIHHACTGNQSASRADRVAGDPQRLAAGGIVDQLHVARVHVDGGRDPGGRRPGDVGGEAVPVDGVVGLHRQEDRRHSGDHAAGADERRRVDVVRGHGGRGGAHEARRIAGTLGAGVFRRSAMAWRWKDSMEAP